MPHNFSNCPLRSSCLLITNHSTQIIVTATDEILDVLGYELTDIIGQSIHTLLFKPLSKISSIPECTIKNATGNIMTFQVCVHQDPLLGESTNSSLDYWLIRPIEDKITDIVLPPAISILKLSPYGTIEQVQLSSNINQPITELIGRPVMAFIYGDDVKPLCSTLSKICSIHTVKLEEQDPLFIRWSRLPCLITHNKDLNDSLNYDWMSFTLSTTTSTSLIKPICIIRSLQIETNTTDIIQQQEEEYSLLSQLLNTLYDMMNESTTSSKVYLKEFYQHIVKQMMEVVTTILYYTQQKGYLKSNYLMQKSLDLLHFTGLFDNHCSLENY